MSHHNHRVSSIVNPESRIQYRVSRIENPTLAHFRHFSSLFTNSPPLHLSRTLYKSTLFMQNKPNFQNFQMSVSNIITMNYKKFNPLAGYKNKPNSNPIKPNFRKAQMNVNLFITKDYRKNDDFSVRINKPNSNPILKEAKMNANSCLTKDYENKRRRGLCKNKAKTNPISEMAKMNTNVFVTKDYENKTAFRPQKNKPNSNPVLSAVEWANFKRGENLLESPRNPESD
jgi:hypothetical protein